jgi:hypothetical protein
MRHNATPDVIGGEAVDLQELSARIKGATERNAHDDAVPQDWNA